MKYRTLGKTGLQVSEIGYGTWQIANDPNSWVGADINESLKSLARFVDLGGNFIDTAWIYGHDNSKPDLHPSEELIGKFMKQSSNRDKLILATKVPPKNMNWPALYGVPVSNVFPNSWIEKCVDDSLRSLGIDVIDLVQFHVWQDDFVKEDEWKETIQKIMKSGKVKYWGISANDYQPTNNLLALDTGLISTVQFIFNLFHQKPTEKLLPYAGKNNIGLIARVPLDEGGLSGNFTLDTKFDEGDLRNRYFKEDRLKQLIERTNALKYLLGQEYKNLPELALKYILSFNEISTVIPGMRKLNHVEANISYSDGKKLSTDLLEKLKSYSWERNFYPGFDPSMKETGYLEP